MGPDFFTQILSTIAIMFSILYIEISVKKSYILVKHIRKNRKQVNNPYM